jgi:hypothetical protein
MPNISTIMPKKCDKNAKNSTKSSLRVQKIPTSDLPLGGSKFGTIYGTAVR